MYRDPQVGLSLLSDSCLWLLSVHLPLSPGQWRLLALEKLSISFPLYLHIFFPPEKFLLPCSASTATRDSVDFGLLHHGVFFHSYPCRAPSHHHSCKAGPDFPCPSLPPHLCLFLWCWINTHTPRSWRSFLNGSVILCSSAASQPCPSPFAEFQLFQSIHKEFLLSQRALCLNRHPIVIWTISCLFAFSFFFLWEGDNGWMGTRQFAVNFLLLEFISAVQCSSVLVS